MKGKTLSKMTQRRAVVAALSFALGAAGTIPAFAAFDSSAPAPTTGLGDTLSNLPFVSFLPGTADNTADGSSGSSGDAGGAVGGGGGLAGGLPIVGGLVSNLPIVGGLLGGSSASGGGLAGGLPIVGGLVSNLPVVGGL
ncbi:MAG: hypothetical protein QOD57_5698, partial [Actinomycetota bacterium]|nr:hypothetical protein [Actinomycetota bacterium]